MLNRDHEWEQAAILYEKVLKLEPLQTNTRQRILLQRAIVLGKSSKIVKVRAKQISCLPLHYLVTIKLVCHLLTLSKNHIMFLFGIEGICVY